MKTKTLAAVLFCSLGLAAGNALACYTVYDASNKVVYQGQQPPVDMSRPIQQTLPRLYPGGHLVFGSGVNCPREQAQPLAAALAAPASSAGSPLLTDQQTAAAMNLRHTVLANGAAFVARRPEQLVAAVVVSPSAAPRRSAQVPVGAVTARPRGNTVITEMHNPPLVAVEDAHGMVVTSLR